MKKLMTIFLLTAFCLIAEEGEKIHLGSNQWIDREDLNSEKNIQSGYQNQWKCPYCYMYWPQGRACQNMNCPSKYKSSGFYWGDSNN